MKTLANLYTARTFTITLVRALIILTATGLLMGACAKKLIAPGVAGKYELRARYGGFAYRNDKFPAGNGTMYVLNSDGTYVRYANKEVVNKGSFIVDLKGNSRKEQIGTITFDGEEYPQKIRLRHDTLTIGTTVTDQIASDYVKIK